MLDGNNFTDDKKNVGKIKYGIECEILKNMEYKKKCTKYKNMKYKKGCYEISRVPSIHIKQSEVITSRNQEGAFSKSIGFSRSKSLEDSSFLLDLFRYKM